MAWSFDVVGDTTSTGAPKRAKNNLFNKASETLTVATSDSAGQDLTTSVVDFLPKGVDFLVIANSGGTNLSSDADLAVKACGTSTGTFALLKDDLIAAMDAVAAASFYDVSSNGEAPFYKFFVDSDGVQKKTDTVTIEVYW